MRNRGVVNQEQVLAWDSENRLSAVTYTNRTSVGGGASLATTCNGITCTRIYFPLVMQQTPAERYSYDADGARVRKETKTEVTRYIGPHFEVTVAITNSQVLTTTKYYDFGGQRIAVRQVVGTNQTLSYLHGDHLGSTSVTTGNSGATTNSVRYYAYGGQRTGNLLALPTDHAFTGQKLDKGTGLMYYGARYYDSTLGTFISPDTIVPNPGNPQNLNRYSYTRNNPLKYRDPTGHWVETAWDILNIGWDIAEVKRDPSLLNMGALVVDVVAVIVPAVPAGAGLIARSSKAAKAAVEIVSHADEAIDATRWASKVADASTGLPRFQNVGAEIVPDLMKAFGDGGHVTGDIPAAFKDRGTKVIGRWWDTEVAEGFGERIFKPAPGASWTAEANHAWLQEAVKNGDVFYLASPVDTRYLLPEKPEYKVAVFARELDALLQAGYRRVGDYLIPPR